MVHLKCESSGLRKTTDKNESFLHNLDKSHSPIVYVRDWNVEPRYEDLRAGIAKIVGAGYEVLGILEAGDAPRATRVYAGTTVVALNEARADAYTAMAELERPISLGWASM